MKIRVREGLGLPLEGQTLDVQSYDETRVFIVKDPIDPKMSRVFFVHEVVVVDDAPVPVN